MIVWGKVIGAGGSGAPGGWDISTAALVHGFSVSAQETSPTGIFFTPDGTKMYVTGYTNDSVYEYDLSTALDVTTASFLQSFSVSAQESAPADLFFKPDGAKMYIVGIGGDEINEYDLSTAWDVSSSAFLQNTKVNTEDDRPSGMFFKPDGTKVYVVGDTNKAIFEYDLSTAWDSSTISLVQSFSVSAQATSPRTIFFKPDGTKMYLVGDDSGAIFEYDLSTAWDVSTSSLLQSFSVASEDTSPTGLFFTLDGTKMYVAGFVNDTVHEYNLAG